MSMNRREFLRTAGGAAGGAAAVSAGASPAAAAEGGGGGGTKPDLGGYLDGANNYSGTVVDETGNDEVSVDVGAGNSGLAFGPAAVHVDNGATVVWEWTGEGGNHNVVSEDDVFNSGPAMASGTFEHTFTEDGIYPYFCSPHKTSGMLGVIVVGTDFPTVSADAATPLDPAHMGVPYQAHFVGIATILAIFMSLIFTFFLLKYGESAHTEGGNN